MRQGRVAAAFDETCALLDTLLQGPTRREILDDASQSNDFTKALLRLRERMRSHVWKAAGGALDLQKAVRKYDTDTRRDGFHVLNDWDGKADRVNADIIPVDVLNYLVDRRGRDAIDRSALAILVDYYLVHLLALLSLNIWEGDADGNLDRLDGLLADLQGAGGSGQLFAENAATLVLIATAHYELEERGFETLLDRVRTLNERHRTNVALGHAASMGSHLRFGFDATYGRDTIVMRDDNVADYPWLCWALVTLMRAYARRAGARRDAIVEALLNGLTGDARAFVGERPPTSLSAAACAAERAEFAGLFAAHRDNLLQEFERYRPSDDRYSPISFFFNFSHNVVKGTVVDALLRGEPWRLTLNDLLTGLGDNSESKEELATTLMEYAQSAPDRIRGRLMPVIVYDPDAGRQAFGVTMRKLRGQ